MVIYWNVIMIAWICVVLGMYGMIWAICRIFDIRPKGIWKRLFTDDYDL